MTDKNNTNKDCFVYTIMDSNGTSGKIAKSINPPERKKQYEVGNPNGLTIGHVEKFDNSKTANQVKQKAMKINVDNGISKTREFFHNTNQKTLDNSIKSATKIVVEGNEDTTKKPPKKNTK